MLPKFLTMSIDMRFFLIIFTTCLIVFIFTNDGHRYTFDEALAQIQLKKIVSMEPDPDFKPGESRKYYEFPELFPPQKNKRPICENYILCSYDRVGHTLTLAPFFIINQKLSILEKDYSWTSSDFTDPHYVFWRNSMDPDIVFLELTYGPTFLSLSVAIFFLICRTFDFSRKISLTVSLIFAFATPIFAYSQTSLNVVPLIFFVLLGYYFYRKFQLNDSKKNLLACGTVLGFAFLVRNDAVLFIIPLFFLIIYDIVIKHTKFPSIFFFSIIPIFSFLFLKFIIIPIRFVEASIPVPVNPKIIPGTHTTPFFEGAVGLLFSPGVGLLIFSPVLFTIFFSFVDFFKNNKKECILFLSFIILFLVYYSTLNNWNGLNAWSARYLLPLIPFMLIPLAASLEKRKSKILRLLLSIPISFGILANIVYVLQDVSWFVWGRFGGNTGLYGLGKMTRAQMRLDPSVIWTFDNSQLTHSIIELIIHPQIDIFLLKIMGTEIFLSVLISLLGMMAFLIIYLLKKSKHSSQLSK